MVAAVLLKKGKLIVDLFCQSKLIQPFDSSSNHLAEAPHPDPPTAPLTPRDIQRPGAGHLYNERQGHGCPMTQVSTVHLFISNTVTDDWV